jgi:hypothetical protein
MSFVKLEAYNDKKWCSFYPLITPVIFEDEIRNLTKEEFEKEKSSGIYGKACIGVCGYNPVWMYSTFKCEHLRVKV